MVLDTRIQKSQLPTHMHGLLRQSAAATTCATNGLTRWLCRLVPSILLLTSITAAKTYLVGPGRQYISLQQVAGLLAAGDTVLVDGDTVYPGGVNFTRPGDSVRRILVRGVKINGRRPVIDGATNAVAFTGGAGGGSHYTFEGFEVRNATFRGVYHQAGDLILRDLVVHHCNNGLMGADNGSGSLLLEYSEFYANGGGTSAHQIYMATDESAHPGSVFRMQFCWIHDGAGGNNVKSRAERNEIYYNWIEGAVYHELELIGPDPAGGIPAGLKREDSDVAGNVLWKKVSAYGGTGTFYVMRLGGDGTGESSGRYRVVHNTILAGTSAVFRLFDSLQSVEMHNNVFCRGSTAAAPIVRTVEAAWVSGERITGRNNWVQSGMTSIPTGWIGTLTGADPAFRDIGAGDLVPGAGSPLVNAGAVSPPSDPTVPFPLPLFPPAFHPPARALLEPGTASFRTISGLPDIGAFESGSSTSVTGTLEERETRLDQAFPNPFNSSSTIGFRIAEPGWVTLAVYDLMGREVAVLVNGQKAPGFYAIRFDARLPGGQASGLPSGVYLYRLTAGQYRHTRKLLVVR